MSSWLCGGMTSTSRPASCMCAAPKVERPAFTRLADATFGPYVVCNARGNRAAVFVSERLAPLSVAGYQRTVARAGEAARFPFQISSHVLAPLCGYKLANDGRDTRSIQHYLGHRSIVSTVRYTALAPDRFKDFWKDRT